MAQRIYSSSLVAMYLIAITYGQLFQPQVRIGGPSGTMVTNGSTYSTTAPLYTNINSLNITCGLNTANFFISRVNLTCPLGLERPLNFSSLGSSGNFLVRVLGTGEVSCECSVTNTSGVVVGRTSFYLNLTVNRYVPRLKPLVWTENLTLADGDSLNVDLGHLQNRIITLSWSVEDGYPQVRNIYLECNNQISLSDTGSRASYHFTIDSTLDGVRCVCSADHVTGLYRLTSSFNFNVTPASLTVRWNRNVVIDGSKFNVPVRYSNQGTKQIREDFHCSGRRQIHEIEFSCIIPGNFRPVSSSASGPSAEFTLTTSTVDKWIRCTCNASYWLLGSKTESVSFQIRSQVTADNKNGRIGMSLALMMGSILTTVLATQRLGDKSWI